MRGGLRAGDTSWRYGQHVRQNNSQVEEASAPRQDWGMSSIIPLAEAGSIIQKWTKAQSNDGKENSRKPEVMRGTLQLIGHDRKLWTGLRLPLMK